MYNIYIYIFIIYISIYIFILYIYIHIYTIYHTSVISVELKGSYYGFGSCQKIICNIEYLDWLKMHFAAWSNVIQQLCPINIWSQYLGAHSYRNDKKICLGMTLYIY